MDTSSSGRTIAHYEILEELGRGGMGVVYKAQDTRLGRTVALKMLPHHLSGDGEAKARFLHEGRAASVLDHSSICTIFDVGETEDGQLFMAMAFVDGPSLADLVAERPLDVGQALEIAIDIGEGLQHSHESGVVHRDMKPSNVMVTSSGQVKVLDFGLAKLAGATMLTASGTTLGTAAYMSPEQVQGLRADERADIWGLGVILYEMITGTRPFDGEYQQALTYAIINEQPEPLTALRTGVPLELDRIVEKALAKDPAERYQHIDEFLVDLRGARNLVSESLNGSRGGTRLPEATKKKTHAIPIALLALLLGIATGILAVLSWNGNSTAVIIKATIETAGVPTGAHPLAPPVAVSPDGSTLVYESGDGSTTMLVMRNLDSFTRSPIEGSQGGRSPFFSPDGQWVGFLTDTELKKYSIESGNTLPISRAPVWAHGATWGTDGTIVVGVTAGLAKVSSNGGELEQFTSTDSDSIGGGWAVWPAFLPGADYVICTIVDGAGQNPKIWAVSLEDGERTYLLDGGNAAYLSQGYLVFPRGNALWVAGFDAETREITSAPIIAFEGVAADLPHEPSIALYGVSDSGLLAIVPMEVGSAGSYLAWLDEDGNIETLSDERRGLFGVNVSPDGRRIATTILDDMGTRQVQVLDLDRQMWIPLTSGSSNFWPGWGLDGETIYMTHEISFTRYELASQRLGSKEISVLTDLPSIHQFRSWIPSTSEALLQMTPSMSAPNFDIVRFKPGSNPEPFITGIQQQIHPAVSPNGKWLAYSVSRDANTDLNYDQFEVYVMAMEDPESSIKISAEDGLAPVWSRDGTRLFYESRAGLMVVEWPHPTRLEPSRPSLFYSGRFIRSLEYGRNYDIGTDGRLLILVTDNEARNLQIVTNWTTEIERLIDR